MGTEGSSSSNEVMVSRKMHQAGIHETIFERNLENGFRRMNIICDSIHPIYSSSKVQKTTISLFASFAIFATEFHFHSILFSVCLYFLRFMSTHFLLHFYFFYLLVVCRNHYPLFVKQTKGKMFRGFPVRLCFLWHNEYYFFSLCSVRHTTRCYK